MAFSHSPKIATDGLVFYYDTGNGKSYKGEPTVNLIPNIGTSTANWTEHGWSGDFVVSSDFENTFELTATNGWHNATYDFGVSSGGTIYVRFEYKLKSHETNQYNMFVLNGTNLGSYTNYIGAGTQSFEWQTFEGSFTANADTKFAIGLRGQDGSGLTDVMYIRNLQVEQKDHATQFVNGSRSVTEGLLDLTKNSTLNLTDVSFTSAAQISFDGTDDHIEVPDNSALDITSEVSFEFVVNADATQSNLYPRLLDKSIYLVHLSQTAPFSIAQNITTSEGLRQVSVGSAFEANTLTHIITTYNGTVGKIYVNGNLINTRSWDNFLPCLANGTALKVGGDGGTNRPLNGDLPLTKIYSRALTADEVAQNYNAIKNRFGI